MEVCVSVSQDYQNADHGKFGWNEIMAIEMETNNYGRVDDLKQSNVTSDPESRLNNCNVTEGVVDVLLASCQTIMEDVPGLSSEFPDASVKVMTQTPSISNSEDIFASMEISASENDDMQASIIEGIADPGTDSSDNDGVKIMIRKTRKILNSDSESDTCNTRAKTPVSTEVSIKKPFKLIDSDSESLPGDSSTENTRL